jgi:signal transduction histidine kinase
MSSLKPRRSSSSRTRIKPPSGVIRAPWKPDLQRAIERELKRPILCLSHRLAAPIACKLASINAFSRFYQLIIHRDNGNPGSNARVAVIVLGDRRRLTQVFDNLLSNTVKFTDGAGEILVDLGTDEKSATVQIIETGPGFDTA